MPQIILHTDDLTKKYSEFFALDRVSITVEHGDIYGLIGRNGAGKTTLFKCVMGLAKPTGGTVTINGETSDLDTARHQMGFMINPSFFGYLNPRENLEYLCQVKGITAKGEVDRLLELVGLVGVKKPFKAFSLGMKQRLGIAGAHERTGATFIISSHILSELDLVATRFGFIEQGILLKEITHTELHELTKKSLVIEVDDPAVARAVLAMHGITDVSVEGNQLTLKSHLNQSDDIAEALVTAGVRVYDLHRQETTLEDYFMKLIGGNENA